MSRKTPPTVLATVETVTPAKAKTMLRSSCPNRPLTQGRVLQYVGAMKRGEWNLNGEAVKFDGDGNLLDGQHRLEAVVQADTQQEFVVVRGLPSESQLTMDQGRQRTLRDVLNMRGVKFASAMALSARATASYEIAGVPFPRFVTPTPTINQLVDCFDRHEDLPHSVYAGGSTNPLLTLSVSWKAALHHLFSHADRSAADTFFQLLHETAPRGETDPITLLRKRLERDATSTYNRLQPTMRVALVVKAFNLYRAGERVGTLVWRPDAGETFPRVVDCELNPDASVAPELRVVA